MPSIAELRKQFPTATKDLDDYQIADIWANDNGVSPDLAYRDFGLEQKNDPGFWSGVKQGLGSMPVGIGRLVQDAGDIGGVGTAIRRYGENVEARNPTPDIQDWEHFKANPWQGVLQFAGSGIGSTLPSLLPFIGQGAKGGEVAGLISRLLAAGRTTEAQTLIAALPSYGATRQQQDQTGEGGALEAIPSALGQGIVESKLGIQRILGAPEKQGLRALIEGEFGKDAWRTAGKQLVRSGIEEGAEEGFQQPMQQLAAYQNPLELEQLKDTGWNMFGGAVGGLTMGPMGGARMGLMHARIANSLRADNFLGDSSTPTDLLKALDARDRFTQDQAQLAFDQHAAPQPFEHPEAQAAMLELQREKQLEQQRTRGYNPVDTEFNDLLINETMDLDQRRQDARDEQTWQNDLLAKKEFDDLYNHESADLAWQRENLSKSQQRRKQIEEAQRKEAARKVFDQTLANSVLAGYAQDRAVATAIQAAQEADARYSAVRNNPQIQGSLQSALNAMLEGAPSLTDLRLYKNSEQTVAPPDPVEALRRRAQEKANGNNGQVVRPGDGVVSQSQEQPSGNPQGPGIATSQGGTAQAGGLNAEAAQGPQAPVVTQGEVNADQASEAPLPAVQEKAQPEQPMQATSGVTRAKLQNLRSSLPAKEKLVFDYVFAHIDDALDAAGKFKFQEIATAIGDTGKSGRSNVKAAVNRIVKRLSGLGLELPSRKVEQSDYSKLGLPPSQQASHLDEETLFGGDKSTPSAGVIASIGGSQSDIGAVDPHDASSEPADSSVQTAEEIARAERQAEEAKANAARENAIVLQHPEANNAASDWNDFKSDKAPAFHELTLGEQADWIHTYVNALFEDNHLAAIESAQRDMEKSLDGTHTVEGDTGAGSRLEGSRGALESPKAETRPAVPSVSGLHVQAARIGWNSVAQERGLPEFDELTPSQQYHLQSSVGDSVAEERAVNAVAKEVAGVAVHRNVRDVKWGENPDKPRMTPLKRGFKDGKEAAQWLASNATDTSLRRIAAKLVPHLDNVEYHVFSGEDELPWYLKGESTKALGLSVRHTDGRREVWLNKSLEGGHSEENLLHELLHSATLHVLRDQAKAKGFSELASAVRHALGTWQGAWPINNPEHRNIANFFANRFRDVDDFVAYAFSSPTFRDVMKLMYADGKWADQARSPAEKYAVNKNAGAKIQPLLPVPKYSMWHRFLDSLAGLVGLKKVFASKIAKIVENNNVVSANNERSKTFSPRMLEDRVNALLDELIGGDSTASSGVGGLPANVRNADSGGLRVAQNANRVETVLNQRYDNIRSSSAWSTASDKMSAWGYGGMFLSDLVEKFKNTPIGSLMAQYYNRIKNISAKAKEYVAEGRKLIAGWQNLDKNTRKNFGWALNAATLNGAWGNLPLNHELNRHLTQERVWVPDSKDYEWRDKLEAEKLAGEKKWSRAKAAYAKIANSPAAADLYQRIFDFGSKMIKQEYILRANALRDTYMESIQRYTTPEQFQKIQSAFSDVNRSMTETKKHIRESLKGNEKALKAFAEMNSAIDDQIGKLRELRGPYFPLMRFGEWFSVYKSAEYSAAEAKLDELREAYDKFQQETPELMSLASEIEDWKSVVANRNMSKTAFAAMQEQKKKVAEKRKGAAAALAESREMRKKIAEAVATLRNMTEEQYDDNGEPSAKQHYIVERHETSGDAEKRVKELNKMPGVAYSQLATAWVQQHNTVGRSFLSKLEGKLAKNLPGTVSGQAQRLVRQTFIETAHDQSSLKHLFLGRKNVSGYDADALRVFGSFVMQSAHRLANMEHFVKMQDTLDALTETVKETDKNGGNMTRAVNELLKRYEMDLDYQEHKWISRLAMVNHLFSLGITPAYILQQVLQTPMIALPMLGARIVNGKPVGMMQAGNLMAAAFHSAAAITKDSWKAGGDLDLEKARDNKLITDGEYKMLKEVFGKELLDIFAEHDIGEIAEGGSAGWRKFKKFTDTVNWTARQIETMNRITTALAAYRAEKGTEEQRSQYAADLVTKSQIDYSDANAPRLLKTNAIGGFGKLLFQFRKYQFAMAYTVANNAVKAFKGDKEAQYLVRNLLITHFIMAGTLGLPIAGPIKLLAFVLGGGSGGDDWEREYKNWLAEMGPLGDVMARGLPAAFGADLHNNVGMGSLFNPMPYLRSGKNGKEEYDELWLSLLGPAIGTGRKFADALTDFSQGRMVDGTAKVLPRWLAGMARAYKLSDQGITDKTGHTHIGADKFDAMDVAMQAMGIPVLETQKYYERVSDFYDMKTVRDDDRKRLLLQASQGEDVRDKIADFNDKYPDDRITQRNILDHKRGMAKYSKDVKDSGLHATKKDASILANIRY